MKKCIRIIGCIGLSILIFSMPILTACSFALDWSGSLKFLLSILSTMEFILITFVVYEEVNDE